MEFSGRYTAVSDGDRYAKVGDTRAGRGFFPLAVIAAGICLFLAQAGSSPAAGLIVDFGRTNGIIRPLHGGNNGPLGYGELVDLTKFHQELAVPFTRLHDSAWPYPDIVDIHAVFPNFDADPSLPASYRFGPTDDYLRAITNTGARIVFRLGESIEHAKRKRYVHPPRDPEKWAAICLGIIRHYNEGWADGHRFDIRYWEIWNEPENRPAMWTGTPEQFYRLYATAAKAIKGQWPLLKVGGPSLGHQGDYRDGKLKPSEFLRGFLDFIQRERAPLNFFSWHLYSNNPSEPARRARAVRAFLDGEGFAKTESHLNEWNYLPDDDWKPMTASQGEARERWYARQGGVEGAAFVAGALIELQDAPLDVANYYSADNQPFGMFTLHGAPKKTYHAFKAFRALLDTPMRADTRGDPAGRVKVLAGIRMDGGAATVFASSLDSGEAGSPLKVRGLPWNGSVEVEVRRIDAERDLEVVRKLVVPVDSVQLPLGLKGPGVVLISLRPQDRK